MVPLRIRVKRPTRRRVSVGRTRFTARGKCKGNEILGQHLAEIARVRATGAGTGETNYYSPLQGALSSVGDRLRPKVICQEGRVDRRCELKLMKRFAFLPRAGGRIVAAKDDDGQSGCLRSMPSLIEGGDALHRPLRSRERG